MIPTAPIGSIPRPAALIEHLVAQRHARRPVDTAFAKIKARVQGTALASQSIAGA